MTDFEYIMLDENSLTCDREEFFSHLSHIIKELKLVEPKVTIIWDLIRIDVSNLKNSQVELLLGSISQYIQPKSDSNIAQIGLVHKNQSIKMKMPKQDILGESYRARLNELLQGETNADGRLYTDKYLKNKVSPLEVEAIINILAKGKHKPKLYTEVNENAILGEVSPLDTEFMLEVYNREKDDIDKLNKNVNKMHNLDNLISVGLEYGLSAKQFKGLDDTLSNQVKNETINNNVILQSLRTVGLSCGLNEEQFKYYMQWLEDLTE